MNKIGKVRMAARAHTTSPMVLALLAANQAEAAPLKDQGLRDEVHISAAARAASAKAAAVATTTVQPPEPAMAVRPKP